MKMIVTGATGFIGRALCEELLLCGHEVAAVVRPGSKSRDKLCFGKNLKNQFSILEISMENLFQLKERVCAADVFYHMAWNGASGADREDFDSQYSNIGYTVEALRVAASCGCHKFIGAGSQAEYGVVHGLAVEGATPASPIMMYGAAKLSAYHMGRLEAQKQGISFVWPRIYSVYGIGENPGTLVNYVMDCLKKGEIPCLTSCENRWNFMYITDCVKALRMLGEQKDTDGIYHVASEDTRLLRDFVEEIRDIMSPGTPLGFGRKDNVPEKTYWLEPEVSRLHQFGMISSVGFGEGIKRKLDKEFR